MKLLHKLMIAGLMLLLHVSSAQALFLSPDPMDPLMTGVGTNRYSYCAGDPINCSDPSGLVGDNWATKDRPKAYDSNGVTHDYDYETGSNHWSYDSRNDNDSSDYSDTVGPHGVGTIGRVLEYSPSTGYIDLGYYNGIYPVGPSPLGVFNPDLGYATPSQNPLELLIGGGLVISITKQGVKNVVNFVGTRRIARSLSAAAVSTTLQSSGRTLSRNAAKHLNEYFGLDLERREWGRALEALKKDHGLRNDFHGKIKSDGSITDKEDGVIGYIVDYID